MNDAQEHYNYFRPDNLQISTKFQGLFWLSS